MSLLKKYPQLKIIQHLARKKKVQIYLVGGFLRDYLLKRPNMDLDFAVSREALKIAKRIKYPVIIKAAAGGGGRGMRVCHNEVRLASAMATAQREAEVAFGNSAVYIEKEQSTDSDGTDDWE